MLTDEQMKKLGVKPYDPADYLKTEKDVQEFLMAAIQEDDPACFVHALGVAARARGMMKLSKKVGCSRTSLYKSFNEKTKPEFETIYNIMREFGVELTLKKSKKRKKELAPA